MFLIINNEDEENSENNKRVKIGGFNVADLSPARRGFLFSESVDGLNRPTNLIVENLISPKKIIK
ncbi:hypothetical protein HZB06_00920 [Candidatus Wolfebacteria bacterium]|nr:hypothetical protein [Candidatus Wolfebacteria bacterium]